jgi:hypothetical protein
MPENWGNADAQGRNASLNRAVIGLPASTAALPEALWERAIVGKRLRSSRDQWVAPTSVIPTGAERSEAKWKDLLLSSRRQEQVPDFAVLRAASLGMTMDKEKAGHCPASS